MQDLILASSSPRRKELLENLRLNFVTSSSDVDESFEPGLPPEDVVQELAYRKAAAVYKDNTAAYVIGSDTVVSVDGEILGKPENETHAIEMLKLLSGRKHYVYTGVAILSSNISTTFFEKTEVMFWELSDEEINWYVQSGEPFDKAGGYGIQGLGSMLVREISGDYFAVVGLPVSRTIRELKKAGYTLPY